ncbi:hypothetical protein DFH11DRAFT_1577302 [Phellopilus nigrolimitatus]|nr:hypothetical protein DFH11DRAFT_1577302 [Phellopilus nigrolimitatus]
MSTPGRSQSQSQFMGMSWSLRPLTVRQALRAMQVHSEAPVTLDGRPLDGVCLVASIVNVSERPQCYVLRVEDGSHGRLLVTLWKPEKERGKNSPSLIENGTLKEGMYARIHGRITCNKRFPNSLIANDAAQVTPVNDPHELFYHLLLCMWVEKKIDKESLQPPEEDLEEAREPAPGRAGAEPEPSPSPAPPSPPDGVEDRGADDMDDAGEDANVDANVDVNEDANIDVNEDANVDANEDADVDANEGANEDAIDEGTDPGADSNTTDAKACTHNIRALSPSPPPSLRTGRLNRTR